MNKLGSIKSHGGVMPLNKNRGPEYQYDMLALTARSVPLSKGSDPKASMHDGPYGGKKPQS